MRVAAVEDDEDGNFEESEHLIKITSMLPHVRLYRSYAAAGLSKLDSRSEITAPPSRDLLQTSKDLLDTQSRAELEKQKVLVLEEALLETEADAHDSVLFAIRAPLVDPNYLQQLKQESS